MHRGINFAIIATVALLAATSAACTREPVLPARPSSSPASSAASHWPADPPRLRRTTTARSTPARPARANRPPTGRAPARQAELPRGGRRILPAYRVVAYYGAPGGGQLGVLGIGTPDEAAAAVAQQAAAYARYGRRIQPAMELIATVAQARPGPDGLYSAPIPSAAIDSYLAAAHRHRLLLILDFQPGRGEFLPQVEADEQFLLDPSVSVALDPEWHVGPTQVPAKVIGSASASSINTVAGYLSRLVARRHLPDKLLVVHQFTSSMLPDRDDIVRPNGLEVVLHADGLATPAEKIHVYNQLAFPAPPFHAGFKLFYQADTGLMTPAQVMALNPQPEVVTYE
ncbi:MAG TPA: hypothetical protein VKB37_16415 [Jatrophihabitantaceae bacterium]|nr:hypothetical protein [Jatrophihabitantaceae bacterium]